MWFRRAAIAIALLPAAAAQQTPSTDPGTLLVRQQLVSMRTLHAATGARRRRQVLGRP